MYGGGYRNSYGSYGSYGGYGSSGYGAYDRYGSRNSLNQSQSTRESEENPNRPDNSRRQVMGEYFKMMGSLRSMVQIGFAFVAFGRLTTQSMEIMKSILNFLMATSGKMVEKIRSWLPSFEKISQIGMGNMKRSFSDKVCLGLRLLGAILFVLALKVKKDISNEVDEEHQIILKKIEKEKEAEEGEEIPQAYFQKEGYF